MLVAFLKTRQARQHWEAADSLCGAWEGGNGGIHRQCEQKADSLGVALTTQDVRVALRESRQHSLQAGWRSDSLLYCGMLKEGPQGFSSLHRCNCTCCRARDAAVQQGIKAVCRQTWGSRFVNVCQLQTVASRRRAGRCPHPAVTQQGDWQAILAERSTIAKALTCGGESAHDSRLLSSKHSASAKPSLTVHSLSEAGQVLQMTSLQLHAAHLIGQPSPAAEHAPRSGAPSAPADPAAALCSSV